MSGIVHSTLSRHIERHHKDQLKKYACISRGSFNMPCRANVTKMIDRSYYCICVEWAWGPGQAKPLARQASWLLAALLYFSCFCQMRLGYLTYLTPAGMQLIDGGRIAACGMCPDHNTHRPALHLSSTIVKCGMKWLITPVSCPHAVASFG